MILAKRILATGLSCLTAMVFSSCIASKASAAEDAAGAVLEQQFRQLPRSAKRLTGPLFWLHGDESKERLEMYVGKVAEGGNGTFTAESRPHSDWLGGGWFRDLAICLEAAKKHDLQMWIFDEKWWPSQSVAGTVPPRYATKCLVAATTDVTGPSPFEADGYSGERYIAAVAGRVAADGKIEGDSLLDLAPNIRDGKLSWQAPAGKWRVIKFTHAQGPALAQTGQPSVDGASKDCVDWFIQTVYQPHFDHFGKDFGTTIPGFFYDEPETCGDWGTELNVVLAERKIDWKKAYVAYKAELTGEEQVAAKYQYLDAFAEAWGRTMYGRITQWCHEHGVKSIGHFMEHGALYANLHFCAGDMMRLQGYSDMGGIDAVFKQFVIGTQRGIQDNPVWQTPKLGSSISHVFGKPDDVAMVEIFGARGQDLTYTEMKWWTNHMQVSGTNFIIPHSFNPKSPYDTDCPPYFYNGGFEPRWPLYRVYADYTSRLSLLLTGGRHVCPVALVFPGQSAHVGHAILPDDMSAALQDARIDCDWMPYGVFEGGCRVEGKELRLHGERYKILVIPPIEVIPSPVLAKAKEFFEAGGVVVGYGFLPSKSATLGHDSKEIASLCQSIWGPNAIPGLKSCRTNAAGGRSYLLNRKPTAAELQQALVADTGVAPTLQVLAGETNNWLHVLHRVKDDRDVFLVCNQNTKGAATQFKFRALAAGEPEVWDAMHNEITAIPFQRVKDNGKDDAVEFSLTLEPLETVLLVFQPKPLVRPSRIDGDTKPAREAIALDRDPNPPSPVVVPNQQANHSMNGCKWVWFPEMKADLLAPPGTRYFRKTLSIPANRKIKEAVFVLAADNHFELFVNGQSIGKGDDWHSVTKVNIDKSLQAGDNTLAVAATNASNAPNPAGLIGRFWIEFEEGPSLIGEIDKTWKTASSEQKDWSGSQCDDSTWATAQEIASLGDGPWGPITSGRVTVSPVAAADPFRSHFTIPTDVDTTKTRVCLEMDDLPDQSASVTINGVYAGGVIGRPLRLDITQHLKKGDNAIVIEPLAPKSARLAFYATGQ